MLAALVAGIALANPTVGSNDVVYQIFPRSFRDSNGDRIGDIKGIEEELPYIQWLGATTILINPIAKSRVYHNYFADDFFTVDPKFGTNADFLRLVQRAHRIGLKVILDIEPQYVTERHPWWDKAGYTWKDGSMWYGMRVPWYDDADVRVAAIDPGNPEVLAEMKRLFRYWAAPNGDVASGADGFRIDHMMDDLDWKHVKTGMLRSFWRPIVEDLRTIKPGAFIVGEQGDWGTGAAQIQDAGIDATFDFPLYLALASFDPSKIAQALTSAGTNGSRWMTFIENHDTKRYASTVASDPRKLRLGAVLNLLSAGVPAIYYGQELGMRGVQGNWGTDGNDIPVRLAMRWSKTRNARGTATWYRNAGPFWSDEFSSDGDGISVEEQKRDGRSLLAFYRKLIALRKRIPAVRSGEQKLLTDPARPGVVAFERFTEASRITILLNFTNESSTYPLAKPARDLLTSKPIAAGDLRLEPFGFALLGP